MALETNGIVLLILLLPSATIDPGGVSRDLGSPIRLQVTLAGVRDVVAGTIPHVFCLGTDALDVHLAHAGHRRVASLLGLRILNVWSNQLLVSEDGALEVINKLVLHFILLIPLIEFHLNI